MNIFLYYYEHFLYTYVHIQAQVYSEGKEVWNCMLNQVSH